MEVAALIDRRPPSDIGASQPGVRMHHGRGHCRRVRPQRASRGCTHRGGGRARAIRPERIDCDLILSAGGYAPAVHLHSQAGGRLRWLDESCHVRARRPAPGLASVGACAGVFAEDAAGHAAEVGRALAAAAKRRRPRPWAEPAARSPRPTCRTLRGKQFVDLQNDVAVSDVGLAAQENYRSVEHLKRYTTTGMGTDQGKTSNINALVLDGRIHRARPPRRWAPPDSGRHSRRSRVGLVVGRRVGELYRPLKRLSGRAWHAARGALFENFGNWRRPAAYPRAGESLETAALREAGAVRRSAGLFDGSPLGKLEMFGRDAAKVSRSHVRRHDVDPEDRPGALWAAAR